MPQEIAGCPGNTKIASGILIQEPAPQIEQPPTGGIFGQAPGGVGTIGALVVGAGVGNGVGGGVGGDGAKVSPNGLHSQTPSPGRIGKEGRKEHKSSGIRPLKPSSCSTPQVSPGKPGIASGILIQEPVPQIEQPPSGGISGQAPGGVGTIGAGTIGALVGSAAGGGATCPKAATTRLASAAKRMRSIILLACVVCEKVNHMYNSIALTFELYSEKP